MDHDIEEAADKAAAGQVPATMKQPATFDVEPYDRLEPAALQPIPGDTVPAEAVEAAVNAAYDYDEARYFNAFKSSIGGMTAALAAAAPLIVADRDATIHRQAVNIRNYRAEVGRLTAERDAAERDRDRFQALLKGSRARIEDVEAVVNRWRGFDMLAAEVRAALAGETPGGPR